MNLRHFVPTLLLSFFALTTTVFAAGEGAPHLDGAYLGLIWVVPFAGILLSIAIWVSASTMGPH